MVKRTSMNLDQDLVRRAAGVLGTSGATETVHRALAEAVRRERLAELARQSFAELLGGKLDELRATRSWPGRSRS
ncbi:MAG: type II toxin-antitoxin system VapB family antitoxin [Actinomycetota bacterium]|nr:type II toxin-antitoxin system VapB family antitoxin [Actinomycetota bacterium]